MNIESTNISITDTARNWRVTRLGAFYINQYQCTTKKNLNEFYIKILKFK